MRLPVDLDGSRGEGGGQILRTALALAVAARRKLRIRRIRAGRANPGLQRQHLACVTAAARMCGARVEGAEIGSQLLVFEPSDAPPPPVLELDIGTAGSTTLVAQTIVLAALAAPTPVRAVITGGTHNPLAPPFEFLDRVYLPHLRAMGADVSLTLERHGLMPKGGGEIVLETRPSRLRPIELVDGGEVVARRAVAIIAGLPRHVGEREIAVAQERLREPACEIRELPGGPHNVFLIEAELASGARELVTAHGKKGYPAEDVADDAIDELIDFLEAGAPVGPHLADQLLLPMALAGGGRFRTTALSPHATTNLDTIAAFLDVRVRQDAAPGGLVDVCVGE